MSEEFDAYRKWLGIPPKEQPPHHYRLLGIAPFEDDADVIQNAADRQMAHIRTFQTGKHGAQSQKILNELATARGCLLDRGRKSEYDAHLRSRLSTENGAAREEKAEPLAPPPAIAIPPPPPGAMPVRPRVIVPPPPAAVAEPVVAEYDGGDVATDDQALGMPMRGMRRSLGRTRSKNNPLVPLVVGGGVVAVLLIVGLIVFASKGERKSVDETPKTTDVPKKPEAKPPASVASSNSKPTTTPPRVEPPKPRPEPPRRFDPPSRQRPTDTADSNLPASPEFTAPTVPERSNATGSERVAFELSAARAAMGRRDMEDAKRRVIDAEYAARDDASKQQVAHVKALCAYLEEFWSAVRQGVYKMKPGESVQSPIGYLVEFRKVEGEMVTYKSANNDHTDKITDVRSSAATVFAKKILGDNDHAHYCIVAFMLLDRPAYGGRNFNARNLHQERLTKAKELYLEVSRRGQGDPVLAREIGGGADMPALDISNSPAPDKTLDTVPDLGPLPGEMPENEGALVDRRTPVPDEKSLGDARKRWLAKFGSSMERARTAELKVEFAQQLRTEAAGAASEPAWQYVLWDKAVDLAAEAGRSDLVVEAIDEQGQTFAIDTFKEKSISLSKLLQANNSSEQVATLQTLAYGLVREAQMAKRYDAAEMLADLALRTARKARDPAAERQINELLPTIRKQQLESTRLEQALARLKVDPADAPANTFAGRHYCLGENNWRVGLPLLAKGNPGDLHDAAAADLSNPTAAGEQAALADRWFKLGRAASDDSRGPLLKRAQHWFELCLPQLAGAERTVAEERLKDIESLLPLVKF